MVQDFQNSLRIDSLDAKKNVWGTDTVAEGKIQFFRIKDIPGIELYRTTEMQQSTSRHFHWVFSMSVAEQGVRYHETRKAAYLVPPGSVLFVNAGEVHSTHSNGLSAFRICC